MAQQVQRFFPAGARKVASKRAPAVAYLYERAGGVYAIAYAFNRGKPEWHFRFKDEARRATSVAKFFAETEAVEARKAERAAEKAAERAKGHTLKVGQVLKSSWGYDQTNVDFYEVVEIVGKHSVKLCKIASESFGESGGAYYDRGYSIPSIEPNRRIGEPFLKRASADNSVKIASYAWASPWDGKKLWTSSYA